jgi:hypothetical protein
VVRVWRLEGTTLIGILDLPVCADTVVSALGTGGQHTITTTYQDYRVSPVEGDVLEEYTLTYVWDDAERRYIWQRPETPVPQATVAPTPTLTSEPPSHRRYSSALHAFANEAYAAVLDMTPLTLDLTAVENPDRMLGEMFLRALSLQMLNQDEAALITFISLAEAAPEHIVGRLAALHFEEMGGD